MIGRIIPIFVARAGLALALLIAILPAGTSRAADYTFSWSLPTPQGNSLNGAVYENASTGYVVGDRGASLKTTDGGIHWQAQTRFPAFGIDLEDVLVLSPGSLLAVGGPPGIFRSDDGGASWNAVSNPSRATLRKVQFAGATTCFAVGDSAQVLRSTDSGQTWTLLTAPGPGDLHNQLWLDPMNGYALGQLLARGTTDGGMTWHTLTGIDEDDTFEVGFITDTQHRYIMSDFTLWESTNSGATWAGTRLPNNFLYPSQVLVLDPQTFLASTGVEGAAINKSTDGGQTWQLLFQTDTGGFKDLDLLPDGTLNTVTNEGDLFRSTDGGITWNNFTYAAYGDPRSNIGAVGIGPTGLGSAGTTGVPPTYWYRSTDAGADWLPDQSGPHIPFTSAISYWDANHAIAAGDFSRMWRTTDGGVTWLAVPLSLPQQMEAYHISLPAAGTAFAAFDGQTQCLVYRTTDYGATWQSRSTGIATNSGIASVSFVSSTLGFAGGGSVQPRLYKTTDAGASWSPVGVAGLPGWIWDTHWFDALTGLVTIPNAPGGIYRTTDGGSTWTGVDAVTCRDMAFSDAQNGGASVSDYTRPGTIETTDDGGATWSTLYLPSPYAGSSISALPDGFFVGGFSSSILRLTRVVSSVDGSANRGGGWGGDGDGDGNRDGLLLSVRSLSGTRFEISFRSPAGAPADLSIFDPLGRHLATLVHGEGGASSSAGEYQWDANGSGSRPVADGVYFLRLAAQGKVRAVKMVICR